MSKPKRDALSDDDLVRLRAILAAAPCLDAQQTAAAREIAARLDVRAMTAERAREVAAIRARHADESGAFCGVAYSWRQAHEDRAALLSILSADVTREALAATPTPPRALTEAAAEARGRLAKTLAKAAEWHGERAGYGGAGQDWHARCQTACADAAAILAASRGDVPPEVRPSGCNRHTDCAAADRSFVAANGRSPTRAFHSHDPDDDYPAPEMAVTTGEEQWTPKPGARVTTAPFVVQSERRAAAGEIIRQCGERAFVVMHDDGDRVHYDADELGPETADAWTPKAGARVRTVDPLTATDEYERHAQATRRAGARGIVIGAYIEDGEVKYRLVRHDDGTEAPYDTDELRPEPTEKSGLCDDPAPRIAPRAVRYAAVMKHDARIQAGLGRDETNPPPTPLRIDPVCNCGAPLSEHAIADQYDGGCFRTGCGMFDDRPTVGGDQ